MLYVCTNTIILRDHLEAYIFTLVRARTRVHTHAHSDMYIREVQKPVENCLKIVLSEMKPTKIVF